MADADQSRAEWRQLKGVVLDLIYPRDSTAKLWELISMYHKEQFPNLTMLVALALVHPVHTSDCERAFSGQNRITTPLRNRLSPTHCDQLMLVKIKGRHCIVWRHQRQRMLFLKIRNDLSTTPCTSVLHFDHRTKSQTSRVNWFVYICTDQEAGQHQAWSGIFFGMGSANEGRHYNVMPPLISGALTDWSLMIIWLSDIYQNSFFWDWIKIVWLVWPKPRSTTHRHGDLSG